jgi:hypothetical protein
MKEKMFFFEKKNQKTFASLRTPMASPRQRLKVFCFFFSKKKAFFPLSFCIAVSACGDLPRPFAGNPGRAALSLANPPPPRLLVPPPENGLLPAPDAASWAQAVADALVADEIPAFAMPSHKGEWMLRLSATLAGVQVTPRYTLIDPKGASKGDVEGNPVPASVWVQAPQAAFQQSAVQAAPQILGLLRAVDASLKQSDPNSLYNRPARIYFSGVTGAPGDGNISLARGIRIRLPDTGDQLVDTPKRADFLLRGTVRLTDEPGGVQQVEIHWIVTDPAGHVAGDVAQGHDMQKGTLDHYWGDIAAAVTDEAAGGVHEVITNFSGRAKAKPKA